MKILVPIKRVIDAYVPIRVKADNSGVESQNVKMAMNPFDEIAVEEAVRMKEAGKASEIVLVGIGPSSFQETLRTGLALGADRAVYIETNEQLEPLNIAKVLKVIVEEEKPQLVILGKQAIDSEDNQTGQMLAALLNWPQATFASKITVQGEKLEVVREIDGGLETLCTTMPCVVTTDLRLNQPRYATLPNIMKAKAKPLAIKKLEALSVQVKAHTQLLKVEAPAKRQAGIKVNSVSELIDKLRNEVRVIP
jgi:electron transfer flavoprotein beta subunit